MPANAQQTAPIAVYGATGFTGRLVAAELRRRGARMVLAGRNPAKLEMVAEEIGGDAETRAVSLDDATGLRDLLEPCSAVIACAGPFSLHGEPVLAAAVDSGTHYLDTTGEQPYMKMAYERYGPGASRAGVAVVPGMGFDYVPGDMIASLTAEGMGELDEIDMFYCWRDFTPSQGTARTTLEMISGRDIEWRNGEWVEAGGSVRRGS